MATPPLPNFPEPALLTALVHQRYKAFDPDGPPTDHLAETNREVTGDQGWSADLTILAPRRTTHALIPLTKPLMDWWQDVVTTTVRSCPPPHYASRNPPQDGPPT